MGRAAPVLDCAGQAALGPCDVAQESEGVEGIGLSGGVGAGDEDALLEGHIHRKEVAPVRQAEVCG